MNQAITFMFFFVMFQLAFLALRQRFKIKLLEQEIQELKNRVNKLMQRKISKKSEIPLDTIQAVKYAMKHAHPDSGGNVEDFIKFQKCYEELTRNGG